MVPVRISRYIDTSLVCPMRHARSLAWTSVIGFQSGSKITTRSAPNVQSHTSYARGEDHGKYIWIAVELTDELQALLHRCGAVNSKGCVTQTGHPVLDDLEHLDGLNEDEGLVVLAVPQLQDLS